MQTVEPFLSRDLLTVTPEDPLPALKANFDGGAHHHLVVIQQVAHGSFVCV